MTGDPVIAAPTFYLGTHHPAWLWRAEFRGVPLFVSHRRLRGRKAPFPRAVTRYAVDSGAFSEIRQFGHWTVTPTEYVAALRRYWAELGPFDWAAQQDSMCEPDMLERVARFTGRPASVEGQQRASVANFVELRRLAPELPIAPTLQGWTLADYMRCVDMLTAAGVDLWAEPVVGVGSVCRRQATGQIEQIMRTLAGLGLRLHGFGVKIEGLRAAGHVLSSADSMAWSWAARKDKTVGCCKGKSGCANCPRWALRWREAALAALDSPSQLTFDFGVVA